jgi:hypothetical protein
LGFGKPPLEEQDQDRSKIGSWSSAGWASPSSCGLWGGDALLLSTGAAEIETLPHGATSIPTTETAAPDVHSVTQERPLWAQSELVQYVLTRGAGWCPGHRGRRRVAPAMQSYRRGEPRHRRVRYAPPAPHSPLSAGESFDGGGGASPPAGDLFGEGGVATIDECTVTGNGGNGILIRDGANAVIRGSQVRCGLITLTQVLFHASKRA